MLTGQVMRCKLRLNLPLLLAIFSILCAFFTHPLFAQTVIILSDMPYSAKEKQMLQGPNGNLYRLINQQKPSVVMHLGDLKNGQSSCTKALLSEHKALLDQVYPGKIIYTPGDNDWTDCDRSSLTQHFDELDSLDFLLKLMYQTSPFLTRNLAKVKSQPTQVENSLWINDRIAISTLHIVGTSNGRANVKQSSLHEAINKVDIRDNLNLDWLNTIATHAKDFDALIIGFQADIYQSAVIKSAACQLSPTKSCDAFARYRQAFDKLAQRIKKPILISHGDTGDFCFEQLNNYLWRLNAAGDFRYLDATKVNFNLNSATMPFTISGLLNPELPNKACHN